MEIAMMEILVSMYVIIEHQEGEEPIAATNSKLCPGFQPTIDEDALPAQQQQKEVFLA